MAENSTKPKIRFKEFTDDWEHREFDELANYKKGPFGSALKKDIFVPKGIKSVKVYEQQNAINKNWQLERYFIKEEYANKLNSFEVHGGDIIVSCAGTIGEMYVLPSNSEIGIINQALMRVRVNEEIVDKNLFVYLFSNMIDAFSKTHSNGSAIKNIPPFSDLKPTRVYVSQKKEQQKITAYLENFDTLINLHQLKYDKLVNIKKAMLEKMFPKNGSKVPEIRFKGFADDWNLYSLQEVATMKARIGWQGLTQKEFLDEGDYYLITGTDFDKGIIDFKNCHYIGEDRYNQDINIQIKNDDVLITKDGTIGKVAYVENMDKPATLNAGVFVIRGKDKNICNLYLYHYLAAPFLLDYADKQATGGTIKHLNQNVLVNFPIPMPKTEEQQKIGAFFKDLDGLIALHQRKYDKLINIKKAMLEKMFV